MNPISSVFVAISFDGYIARTGVEPDWLDAANKTVHEDEDFGFVQLPYEVIKQGAKQNE